MLVAELKQKLRQYKKLEGQIRFGSAPPDPRQRYVWSDYFSTKDEHDPKVRYNMASLIKLDHEGMKAVFDAYFTHVYFEYFRETGIVPQGMYDTGLLSNLGLAPDASINEIKSRFRELAKIYHPDHGGDSGKFMELFSAYKKLTGDKQ